VLAEPLTVEGFIAVAGARRDDAVRPLEPIANLRLGKASVLLGTCAVVENAGLAFPTAAFAIGGLASAATVAAPRGIFFPPRAAELLPELAADLHEADCMRRRLDRASHLCCRENRVGAQSVP